MMEALKRWALQLAAFLEMDLGDDELNRRAFTLNIAVLYLFGAVLLQMLAVMFFLGYRPVSEAGTALPPMPAGVRLTALLVMGMLIADFVTYALVRAGQIGKGAWILVLTLAIYAVTESTLAGGSGGWELLFVIPVLLALLTISWRVGAVLTFILLFFHVVTLHILEFGWFAVRVYPMTGFQGMMLEVLNLFIAFVFLLVMVGVNLFLLRRSLQESRQAQQRAEVLSLALERRLEEQEEVRRLLEQVVERYTDFLVEASKGREIALLEVEEPVTEETSAAGVTRAVLRSLRLLGEAINETVRRLWTLLQESEAARREADAARRRYTRRAWESYLREREKRHVVELGAPVDETSLQQAEHSALNWQGVAIVHEEDVDALAVPIAVGDQVIGMMTLQQMAESPASRWTDEERRFVALIADRLSMALNTLRLLDETQRREARERFISQFTTRLRAAATVEEALSDAMQALRYTFGTEEIVTHLRIEPSQEGGAEQ